MDCGSRHNDCDDTDVPWRESIPSGEGMNMDILSFLTGAILGAVVIVILVGRRVVKEQADHWRYMNPESVDDLRKRDWYWNASPGLRQRLEESTRPPARG